MSEQRKRLGSSMTYDEYVHTYEKAPLKPCMKPLQDPDIQLEDLDLQDENDTKQIEISPSKIKNIYKPEHVIQEEDDEAKTPVEWIEHKLPKGMTGRQRAQSENIQFTFISFMERGIERKQSRNLE